MVFYKLILVLIKLALILRMHKNPSLRILYVKNRNNRRKICEFKIILTKQFFK